MRRFVAALGKAISDTPKVIKFVPFDPGTKMSEATAQDPGGGTQRIVKGAFAAVIGLTQPLPTCDSRVKGTRGERLQGTGGRGRPAECDEAGRADRPQRSAAQGFGGAHYRIAPTRRPHRHGDGRRARQRQPSSLMRWGSTAPSVRQGRSRTASGPNNSRSSPVFCRRTSTNWSRRSRRAAILSECAATAPTTRRRCARRRSESRSQRRQMSRNRPQAWC